jgi:hypothetical protein
MKPIFLFILLVLSFYSYGQFAGVSDKDGFVHVRKKDQQKATLYIF